MIGSSVWNGNVHWALNYDLETLSQGDIIGCRVREGGRLCFYVNGEYKRYKGQALANLPENEPLYGFVELYGDAVRARVLPVVGEAPAISYTIIIIMLLLDRSGGKGSGYVSGGGLLKSNYRMALSPKKHSLDSDTKNRGATLHLISSNSSFHSASDDSINRSMTIAAGSSSELSMSSMKWKNRAFGCFHERASPNITFKENRAIALRRQPGNSNGFVFTQEPIRLGETFVVRLLELSRNYHVSLVNHKYSLNEKYDTLFLGNWTDNTGSINNSHTKEFCIS